MAWGPAVMAADRGQVAIFPGMAYILFMVFAYNKGRDGRDETISQNKVFSVLKYSVYPISLFCGANIMGLKNRKHFWCH